VLGSTSKIQFVCLQMSLLLPSSLPHVILMRQRPRCNEMASGLPCFFLCPALTFLSL